MHQSLKNCANINKFNLIFIIINYNKKIINIFFLYEKAQDQGGGAATFHENVLYTIFVDHSPAEQPPILYGYAAGNGNKEYINDNYIFIWFIIE